MGQCETPDAPLAGSVQCEDVAGLFSKRCNVTCEDSKKFLRPVPKFYSCGPIGVWNTASPMLKFRFPPCGGRFSFENFLFTINLIKYASYLPMGHGFGT